MFLEPFLVRTDFVLKADLECRGLGSRHHFNCVNQIHIEVMWHFFVVNYLHLDDLRLPHDFVDVGLSGDVETNVEE